MIKALISDFSRVLLFPKDLDYTYSLNGLHRELSAQHDYRLLDHFQLNTELMDYYKSLENKLDLYIFTTDMIQDSAELQPFINPIFKGVYSSFKMGVNKRESKAYKTLVATLGLSPEEGVYIDDSEGNITAAQEAGLHAILYKDNESVKSELQVKLRTH